MSSYEMNEKLDGNQHDAGDGRRVGADRRMSADERRRGGNRLLEVIVSRSQVARDRRQDNRRSADVPKNWWGFWRRGQKKLTG
ncbi:MAG: hypothetical protein KUG75_14425 [Pseudomonadales bacterium]|nr:hypothetical protein [Pseudomonadales bacterium]